jgi:hypothetical protein
VLKHLVNRPNTKHRGIFRDNKLIFHTISYGKLNKPRKSGAKYKYNIKIYDSYLLLPLSLDKLAKSLGINVAKGMFPLKVLNNPKYFSKKSGYKYIGNLPPVSQFHHPDPLLKDKFELFMEKYRALAEKYKDSP